jgi:amino-acid N-acetyltransferase
MQSFMLRQADETDFAIIRSMIRTAGINPMGLAWERFVVAVDAEGKIIGCGQIKPHSDGTRELASVVVIPDWRGQGVARAIIEQLIAEHRGELYLTCREELGRLYEKFGFVRLNDKALPPYFRRIRKIFRGIHQLGLVHENLLVMKRDD